MAIKEDIKKGEYKNVYLICGEEDYLKDYYSSMLIKKLVDKDFYDFNYLEFKGVKPEKTRIDEFVSSYPFASEKKVVYIKDSDIFKSLGEDEFLYYKDLFENLSDYVVIVFSERNVTKTTKLYKYVKDIFSVDEFEIQKEADLVTWIKNKVSKFNKTIEYNECVYLMESSSKNMYILDGEITKLCFFNLKSNKITKEDIDKSVCAVPEDRVFKMIDDILFGNYDKAIEKYNELKLLKQEPVFINGIIFSRFYSIKALKELNGTKPTSEIAKLTKQPEFVIKNNMKFIAKLSYEYINNILKLCTDYDYKIKNGLISPWTALDTIMVNMTKK